MSDLLKSAMGYFNAGPTTTTTTASSSGSDNDFVGQIVEVGSLKLRVKRVIAEGQSLFQAFEPFELVFHCMPTIINATIMMHFWLITSHFLLYIVHAAIETWQHLFLKFILCFWLFSIKCDGNDIEPIKQRKFPLLLFPPSSFITIWNAII